MRRIKLYIRIVLNYSRYYRDNPQGLTQDQINFLKDLKEEVEELWSGDVEFNGEDYAFNVMVELNELDSWDEAILRTQSFEGENTVKNASLNDPLEGLGVGVTGSTLYVNKDFITRKYTSSHEVGHLLGLPDLGYDSRNIMGYHIDRVSPKAYDRFQVIENNLNLSITGPQRIYGRK